MCVCEMCVHAHTIIRTHKFTYLFSSRSSPWVSFPVKGKISILEGRDRRERWRGDERREKEGRERNGRIVLTPQEHFKKITWAYMVEHLIESIADVLYCMY